MLIVLLPAPGTNLVRFHGQFAPGARWRSVITAVAAPERKRPPPPRDEEQRQRRMSWALLLKRSFAVDALVCPHCGSRRELLAVIEHKPTVQKILEHLGLASEPLAFAAPRGPPLLAGLEVSATDDQRQVEPDAERRVDVDLDFVEPDYD